MSKNEKILVITLLLMLLVSSKMAGAASQVITMVDPQQNVAGLDQQFSVDIKIADAQNLFGLEAKLHWNASVLQLVSTQDFLGIESFPNGVLHEDLDGNIWKDTNTKADEYTLLATSIGAQTPSFNGSGTIVKLTFSVVGVGSCELTLQTALYDKPLPDEAATPIQHSMQNGFYSLIYVSVSSSEAFLGETINISGYVNTAEEYPQIAIEYMQQNEANWLTLKNVPPDNQGNFSLEWTPQKEGEYKIKATTTIQDTKIESSIIHINIKPKNETLNVIYLVIIIVAVIAILITVLILHRRRSKIKKNT